MPGLQPNLDEARRFLDALGAGEDFTFQTFPDCKGVSKEGKARLSKLLTRVFHGRIDAHADQLVRLNTGDEAAGVFVTVNRTNGNGRKAADVVGIRAVFVDLDGAPIEPVMSDPLAPNMVVESSPGRFHAYWLVRDLPLNEFTSFQKMLAARFGGDTSVSDLPRVLRLPGFFHRKGAPFRSRLVVCKPERVYDRAELVAAFGEPGTAADKGTTPESQIKPEYSADLESVKAKRLAAVQAERVILRPNAGRHRLALQLGYDCRREDLSEDGARTAAREYHALIPDTDSDGQHKPLSIGELEVAVVNAYAENKTVNRNVRLSNLIIVGPEIAKLQIEPRNPIIEPFLMERSLSMIYAKRGVGKTWLALELALAIATGRNFFKWSVNGAHRVLYIDGEMPLSDIQERTTKLANGLLPENLMLLSSEVLFREQRSLVINKSEDQKAILEALDDLEERGQCPDVLIFDNLSSLTGGIDENSNSDLDTLRRFLFGLRHRGLAVVLIHHAGKGGDQRGASGREDQLDTTIKLEEIPRGARQGPSGAAFTLTFEKTRGKRPSPDTLTVELISSAEGGLTWAVGTPASLSADMRALIEIYKSTPSSQKELAHKLEVTEERVSQLAGKLRDRGLLARGKGLNLTREGRERAEQLGAGSGPI